MPTQSSKLSLDTSATSQDSPLANPCHNNDTDVSILEYNLSLSYEERLLNHQRALEVLQEILKARKALY